MTLCAPSFDSAQDTPARFEIFWIIKVRLSLQMIFHHIYQVIDIKGFVYVAIGLA